MNGDNWFNQDVLQLSKDDWAELINDQSVFNQEILEIVLFVFSQPAYQSTATEIAHNMGVRYQKVTQINRAAARKIYKKYNTNPPINERGGNRFWNCLFDSDKILKDNRYFVWRLRPKLIDALKETLEEKPLCIMGNELELSSEQIFEDAAHFITKKAYGRSALAKKICLDHFGAKCQICGFDYRLIYGEGFDPIIHIHHIVPLNEKNCIRPIDPKKDLIPVCPNCHMALHRKDPPYQPDELARTVRRNVAHMPSLLS